MILLYPVYALLFADTGLSTAEISSLFVIWSLTGLVLEVPSGVWADVVSRRLLLIIAPLLTGLGYAFWTVSPSYPVFALGFVLWGAQGALRSGALESLVYDELAVQGDTARYAGLMGRSRAAGMVAVVIAMGAASPVMDFGGYEAVGIASVIACVFVAGAGAALPEHRPTRAIPSGLDAAGDIPAARAVGDSSFGTGTLSGLRAYWSVLRAGLREVATQRRVRLWLTLVPVVASIWGALDEYVPLLAVEMGIAEPQVPWFLVIVYSGVVVGALVAGRVTELTTGGLAGLLATGAVTMGVAVLGAGSLWVGSFGVVVSLSLLAAAFGVFQVAEVGADARLQHAISGDARATVTSLSGFGTEIATIAVFGGYAAGSAASTHPTVFAAWSVAYLLVALLLVLPRSRLRRPLTPALRSDGWCRPVGGRRL